MKKIAMIIPSLRNVGPVRVAYDIIDQLQKKYDKKFIQFEVFYLDDDGDMTFPCKQTRLTILSLFRLYSFDIIHSHMFRPDCINSLIPFYKGRKITTIHNIVETDLFYSHGKNVSAIFSRVWKYMWKGVDVQVVLTTVAKDYYINKMKLVERNVVVINNGVGELKKPDCYDDDVLYAVNSFRSKGYRVLGTVALFNRRKGLEQILNMLSVDHNSACVIIGDGPIINELKKLGTDLGIDDKLYFSGFKNNGKEHIFLFDCYVMPSREEGFPLALTEALSSGVVTVCSNIPVFKEILDKNTTTFFDLDDINSLVNAVNFSIANSAELANNAKVKFNKNYTRIIMADRYFCLYNESDSDDRVLIR